MFRLYFAVLLQFIIHTESMKKILIIIVSSLSITVSADDKDWVNLYNGKDLSGWQTTGNWLPQKDGTLLIQPRPGEKGWQRYGAYLWSCLLYTSPSPRDQRGSRMPSSA